VPRRRLRTTARQQRGCRKPQAVKLRSIASEDRQKNMPETCWAICISINHHCCI
jgi:hypothetical protein